MKYLNICLILITASIISCTGIIHKKAADIQISKLTTICEHIDACIVVTDEYCTVAKEYQPLLKKVDYFGLPDTVKAKIENSFDKPYDEQEEHFYFNTLQYIRDLLGLAAIAKHVHGEVHPNYNSTQDSIDLAFYKKYENKIDEAALYNVDNKLEILEKKLEEIKTSMNDRFPHGNGFDECENLKAFRKKDAQFRPIAFRYTPIGAN